jgi:hypothetical protein
MDVTRWRRDPLAFFADVLRDPETGEAFVLSAAQAEFVRLAFTATPDGRLPLPELLFACPKKGGKSTLAAMARAWRKKEIAMRIRARWSCASLTALLALNAQAGTKFVSSIVPADTNNPALSSASKIIKTSSSKDTVKLKGVTNLGMLVTTDQSWLDPTNPTLTGDEYMVIVHGRFLAASADFDLIIPMELKKGAGSSTQSYPNLLALNPPGYSRAVEIAGVEVFFPIGTDPTQLAACAAVMTDPNLPGLVLFGATNPCGLGLPVGVSGLVF